MIKVNIEINNKSWNKKIKKPKKYFNQKLKKVSKLIDIFKKKNITFTILLTNSKTMKKLNNKFRKNNKTTDVLSFPFFTPKYLQSIKEKNIYIGDIAISYEIINLRSKKITFSVNFDQAWVHGLLHLLGYDHIQNKDYFKMNTIEKRILNFIA